MADLPILTIYDRYTQTVQVVSKVILGSTPLPVSSNTVRSAYQDPVCYFSLKAECILDMYF